MRAPPAAKRAFGCAVAAAAVALLSGCASPQTAIANLSELYKKSRSQERAVYATEVSDRGFFTQAGDDIQDLFSNAPREQEVEELEDPVEFALDNLALVASVSKDGLELVERAYAIAVVSEMGRLDPSRIVRARAYEATARLWRDLPIVNYRFQTRPVDETALNVELDALIALAGTPHDQRPQFVQSHAEALERGARVLIAARPDAYPLSSRLLMLAAKCTRIVERNGPAPEIVALLETAAVELAVHVAYLSARPEAPGGFAAYGAFDPSPDVRIAAGRLLIQVDPVAATADLGKDPFRVWLRTRDPLVRIAWLQALSEARLTAAGVHPMLREALALALESAEQDEDAAVEWWTRRALAGLLGLDPESASVVEVRSKWLALGEWNENART